MENNKLTKSDINKVYVRNLFGFQWGWNYEKMQGLGYAWVIMPALKRIYKNNPEGMKKALKMQLGYFNTTPAMSHLIIGADMALEESLGEKSEEAVSSLKTGLMGPFAGVGDTLFLAIYRAIVFSIASYVALDGNAIGLIVPVFACLAVLFLRYKFTYLGYNQSKKLAVGFANSIAPITEGAAILGLTVVGGLIASVITYKLNLTFNLGEVSLDIQSMLDKIMPSLIPLLVVLFSYWLLGKKKFNSTHLIVVIIAIGMVLGNSQGMLDFVIGLFSK
ncbi:PTS system mannose/fructose/sorbose family transporter subunit IID [Brachyspira hyodysenteriae]|uniref:PTS system, IID component n=2 Tax=Brachyspira hyodysenteriae TaxID=159 RepID=A0A3B6V9R2_BRAHW|nr:PTS system mannose/fructose/sorbose family transporter subunit IID [Brachyspira hyodysenteriae]ACN84225.1 PTS system, IID component [Brachyspira hyodysenteriae WA1]ANN63672.1 PTS mannose transporter subunit IID [Brachyspira hyodysenteriae ATCC 27164]AUJ49953.1 PTS mannose transporter subunit IID [Brachyspira hyodysenteriae]KLI13204.1 PTS mannose transporter subunit IID [Brachyspira hyodysenteriae]KLI19304.1 PTS mannose transporter subunit IID [Brachyspira hyodysenteriae]